MPLDTPSALLPSEVHADTLIERAVLHCAARRHEPPADTIAWLQQGDGETHSTFRYALAKELGAYLGSLGASFSAVYVYGSAMGSTASPCSDIDILVVVRHPRYEVMRLLLAVDLALASRYRELLGRGESPRTLLDVSVIDDVEERERRGMGAILSRLGTCPVCLWRFTTEVTAGALREGSPRRSLARSSER